MSIHEGSGVDPVQEAEKKLDGQLNESAHNPIAVRIAFIEYQNLVYETSGNPLSALAIVEGKARAVLVSERRRGRAVNSDSPAAYFQGVIATLDADRILLERFDTQLGNRQEPSKHGGPVISEGRTVSWQDERKDSPSRVVEDEGEIGW